MKKVLLASILLFTSAIATAAVYIGETNCSSCFSTSSFVNAGEQFMFNHFCNGNPFTCNGITPQSHVTVHVEGIVSGADITYMYSEANDENGQWRSYFTYMGIIGGCTVHVIGGNN